MQATIVRLNSVTAFVEGDFSRPALSKALSYMAPGYRFIPAYRNHVWDGRVRLLKQVGDGFAFPAGLYRFVKRHLKEEGLTVKVLDKRERPDLRVADAEEAPLEGKALYPWQEEAVQKALKKQVGIIKAATGSGKSVIMAGIIARLKRPNGGRPRTLVIVPNRGLLLQTREALESMLGHKVGHIGFGEFAPQRVTVALPNSLSLPKLKDVVDPYLKRVQLLLLDEAHHGPAKKWSEALKKCTAFYRFGLSGTPFDRGDESGMVLEGLTGPIIVDIPTSVLVEQNKLARPLVRMQDMKLPELPVRLPWADVYGLGVVRNRRLNERVVALALRERDAGHQVLVLVTRIEHGANIQQLFAEAHEEVTFLHGGTSTEEIQEKLASFRRAEFPLLIASPIFGEGIDIPAIDVLIIADGGKSVIRTIQKVGRALRPKVGKPNTCTIYDFNMYVHKYLLRHSVDRYKVYAHQGFEVVNPPSAWVLEKMLRAPRPRLKPEVRERLGLPPAKPRRERRTRAA